jgi:hypothetical protein
VITIVEALAEGKSRRAAAAAAGISHETFYQWRHADPEFAEMADRAIQIYGNSLVERIRLAVAEGVTTRWYDAQGNVLLERREFDWHAAAWLLEHHPDLDGRRRNAAASVEAQ